MARPTPPGDTLPPGLRSKMVSIAEEFCETVSAAVLPGLEADPESAQRVRWLATYRLVHFFRLPPPSPPSKEWLEANVPDAYWSYFIMVPHAQLEESWRVRGVYYMLHECLLVGAVQGEMTAGLQVREEQARRHAQAPRIPPVPDARP